MKVIGISGHQVAGKDTIADYLSTKGFSKYTMSDILREEMRELGLSLDRDSMNKYSTEIKLKNGNDYLAHKIIKKISGNSTIPGIRSGLEVETLRKELGDKFILVAVHALLEKRYEWAKDRNRDGDNVTFEKFVEQQEKERNSSHGVHEIDKVIEMADLQIENNGTKEELYRKVDELIF